MKKVISIIKYEYSYGQGKFDTVHRNISFGFKTVHGTSGVLLISKLRNYGKEKGTNLMHCVSNLA